MKKLAWLIPIAIILHSGFSYAWLMIANSDSPSPGKEVIFLGFIFMMTAIFWKLKALKEVGIFSAVTGFVGGVIGVVVAAVYFPGVFHEMDIQANMLGSLFKGGVVFVFLYFLYGYAIFWTRKIF
jgi:hypothetical protein